MINAAQAGSAQGQGGKEPGNKDKKPELSSRASDNVLSTEAALSEQG